ncbi:MAG: rod shape-determining protein MreC [Steroidobacteraceae bacterium]
MATHEPDPRPLLLGGPALGLRLIVLALMSAGLMVADHRQHRLAAFRDWVSTAAYPFQWAVQAPLAAWIATRESLATRARVEADNVRLAADNLVLRLKTMRFESLEQENQRLRAARESSARVVQRSLVAEIVRVDLDPFRQRVLVNKGGKDGVFRGQAALDANGIFGQVTRAGPISAEVILISDPEHAIPVQVNRTGTRSIALGTGRSGLLSLPYLPQNTDVIVGDLLVSSGLGGVYPPGYPVGKVSAIVRDPAQPLLAVEAEPLAALDRDPEVLLVWFDRTIVEPEPEPEPEAPAAAAAATQPAPPTQAPSLQAPSPAPQAETPAPQVETPTPQVETPAPQAETPTPETHTPAPQTEGPVPQAEPDAPESETLPPATESVPPETGGR